MNETGVPLAVPVGRTTPLNPAVGLATPTAGISTCSTARPTRSPAALDGIAFVTQDSQS